MAGVINFFGYIQFLVQSPTKISAPGTGALKWFMRFFGLFVESLELEQVLVTLLGVLLGCREELGSSLGELAGQTAVARLVHQELLVTAGRLLAVESEGLLCVRIESEQIPVTALDSLLHLLLAVLHTALDAVHLAGGVSDDEGRALVSLGLGDSLEGLDLVCAHCDLCNVDVTVGHSDLGERLGLDFLTGSRELSDLTDVGSLGGLSAGVGVNLGVEDEDVDVLTGGENMVDAAEADVVCPTVAAEDPDGLLVEVILLCEDLLGSVAACAVCLDDGEKTLCGLLVVVAVVIGGEVILSGLLELVALSVLSNCFDALLQVVTDLLLAEVDAEAVLSVILEEGVCPCGTLAFLVDGVGRSCSRAAPDGRAAGSVGAE